MAQQLNGWGRATGWGTLTFGLAGAGAIGQESATGTAEVAITNVIGTTALNSVGLITNNILAVTLGAATSSLGSVSPSAASTVYPTGVLGTTGTTSLLIWTPVLPGVTDNFNPIVTGQSTNWQEVA